MKTYSEKIKALYTKWINAIDNEPRDSYDINYKKWQAKEKRCARNFEAGCKAEGLKYMDVYYDLLGNKPMIINP